MPSQASTVRASDRGGPDSCHPGSGLRGWRVPPAAVIAASSPPGHRGHMGTAATPAVPVRAASPAPPGVGVGVTCPGWAHGGVSRGVPCASGAGTKERGKFDGGERRRRGSSPPGRRTSPRPAVRACGKLEERHGEPGTEPGTGGSGCVFPPGAACSRRTGGGGSTGGLHGDGGAASVSPADSRRGGRHRSPGLARAPASPPSAPPALAPLPASCPRPGLVLGGD